MENNLPDWMTVNKKKRDVWQAFVYLIYDKVNHFSLEEKQDAINSYEEAKTKNPSFEKSFENSFFTNEMIKEGYNKNPEDIVENTSLTYREVINAFYYKAYNENLYRLKEMQDKKIKQVFRKEVKKFTV